MNSSASKIVVEGLQLAPPEERLLQRLVSPDSPSRLKKFFQRLIVVGLGFVLLRLVGDLMASLDDFRREGLHWVLFLGFLFVLDLRDTRIALQERLIRKLYSELTQENSYHDRLGEQHKTTDDQA
jgi:hypothetical protein